MTGCALSCSIDKKHCFDTLTLIYDITHTHTHTYRPSIGTHTHTLIHRGENTRLEMESKFKPGIIYSLPGRISKTNHLFPPTIFNVIGNNNGRKCFRKNFQENFRFVLFEKKIQFMNYGSGYDK